MATTASRGLEKVLQPERCNKLQYYRTFGVIGDIPLSGAKKQHLATAFGDFRGGAGKTSVSADLNLPAMGWQVWQLPAVFAQSGQTKMQKVKPTLHMWWAM